MVNHHAKRYFYNEKPRFLHTYANDHFFLFFIFFIQTVLFTISKSEPPDFEKIFQKNFFQPFFDFFWFYFFMVVLRNKSKKWLFFCHATFVMIFYYEKTSFDFLWFYFLFYSKFLFYFNSILCINVFAL